MPHDDIQLREYRILEDNSDDDNNARSSSTSSFGASSLVSSGRDSQRVQPTEELERRLGLWSGMAIVIGTI
ncbi:hypothetical protein GGI23_005392, partial [Coemansia sp. RSA 2559]